MSQESLKFSLRFFNKLLISAVTSSGQVCIVRGRSRSSVSARNSTFLKIVRLPRYEILILSLELWAHLKNCLTCRISITHSGMRPWCTFQIITSRLTRKKRKNIQYIHKVRWINSQMNNRCCLTHFFLINYLSPEILTGVSVSCVGSWDGTAG